MDRVNPIADAIAEVRANRLSYTAENASRSRTSANVVGKAGTTTFHGSLFEFLLDDAFDALQQTGENRAFKSWTARSRHGYVTCISLPEVTTGA